MSGFQRTRGHTSGGGGGGLLGPTPRGNHGHHTHVVSRHGLLPPPALPVTTNPAAPFATASGHPRRDPGAGRYVHPLPPAYPQPRPVATGRRPASGRGGGAGAGAGGAATSAPRSGILPTPDSSRVNPLMAHVGDCQRELDQTWMQAFMRDQLSKPCASDDASTAQSPAAQHACVSVSEDQLAADRAYLWFCQSSIDPSVRAAVRYVCRAGYGLCRILSMSPRAGVAGMGSLLAPHAVAVASCQRYAVSVATVRGLVRPLSALVRPPGCPRPSATIPRDQCLA